jgi:hypothetical protein
MTHHQAAIDEQIRAALVEERCQRSAPREGIRACAPELAASFIRTDGLALLANVLSTDSSQRLLVHVQERLAQATALEPDSAASPFGDVLCRKNRYDLMLRADDPPVRRAISDALRSIAPCVERLLGQGALLYECSALVSDPGAPRQQIHPDTPFRRSPVALTIFISLQDVTVEMGPTVFLPRSHTEACHEAYHSKDAPDMEEVLRSHPCVTGIMRCGDAVVFDSRLLHCGSANTSSRRRVLFYLSFRKPSVALPGTMCACDKERWALRRGVPPRLVGKGVASPQASPRQSRSAHMGRTPICYLKDTSKSARSSRRSMWPGPAWTRGWLRLWLAQLAIAVLIYLVLGFVLPFPFWFWPS